MERPIFTISLDFELHWGRFDKYPVEKFLSYYSETKKTIPKMLALFEEYGIHATWAAVGGLMAENLEEWKLYAPKLVPTYEEKVFSAYHWVESQPKLFPEILFAPELIWEILQTKGQELGCHTFAHYYTCEKGQQLDQFRADLKACQKFAIEKFNVKLESLVFPRNQYDNQAITVAAEEGFGTLRSNPSDWFWKRTEERSIIKKLFRTGDTLIKMGKDSFYSLPSSGLGRKPILLPTSRLLRPYVGNRIIHQRRISRIKSEMKQAASKGLVYHLWWHPHNFGQFPNENLHFLKELLEFFNGLRESYGMESLNMNETAIAVRKKGA